MDLRLVAHRLQRPVHSCHGVCSPFAAGESVQYGGYAVPEGAPIQADLFAGRTRSGIRAASCDTDSTVPTQPSPTGTPTHRSLPQTHRSGPRFRRPSERQLLGRTSSQDYVPSVSPLPGSSSSRRNGAAAVVGDRGSAVHTHGPRRGEVDGSPGKVTPPDLAFNRTPGEDRRGAGHRRRAGDVVGARRVGGARRRSGGILGRRPKNGRQRSSAEDRTCTPLAAHAVMPSRRRSRQPSPASPSAGTPSGRRGTV